MDIRNWTIGRIMQLPDWCFGRRWPIGLSAQISEAPPIYDLAEYALPERCVIWEVKVWTDGPFDTGVAITLALGDQIPATDLQFSQMEMVFGGLVGIGGIRGALTVMSQTGDGHRMLRVPITASGRRFVAKFFRAKGNSLNAGVTLVVSSMPTEVPDWLISGMARTQ